MVGADMEIIASLREKAAALPLTPGVYIMKDGVGKIIYVGKSKALKNRVSSYFTDLDGHNVKTAKMVSQVRTFEYILTDTNMEALALENQLIKLHMPKFNIRLKDGKNYPYIRISFEREYPDITFVRRRASSASDTSALGRARYFGPYSGASVAHSLIVTAQKAFGLASCSRSFPRDIGKGRPCIYKQLGQCCAPCDGSVGSQEYRERFKRAALLLNGSFSGVKKMLTEQMEKAAEELNFEGAAVLRDRIAALEACRSKQKVVGAPEDERDVIAFDRELGVTSLSVFFIREGSVVDTCGRIFGEEVLAEDEDIIAFLCELYRGRQYIPDEILLDNAVDAELLGELEEFLSALRLEGLEGAQATLCEEPAVSSDNDGILSSETAGHGEVDTERKKSRLSRVHVRIPEKGDAKKLCRMVRENAIEAARQYVDHEKKQDETAVRLAALLGLEVVPSLIEVYDISNYGNDDITAGKIAARDGRLQKSAYRTYKIRSVEGQDDYASMAEAVRRRLAHAEDEYPDLILLDGGRGHVSTIRRLLSELDVHIPVFGLVKDEYHKTRAIAGEHEDEEVSIAKETAVFRFVYRLQEEVHRFTVGKVRGAKRGAMRHSVLTDIPGIGEIKARALTAHFRTLTAIKAVDVDELMTVSGVTRANAVSIIEFFKEQK